MPPEPVAAVADPPIAMAAPPPNPASNRAAAATVFLVLFITEVSLDSNERPPGRADHWRLQLDTVRQASFGCHRSVRNDSDGLISTYLASG
ncbi:hypothetical protein GCM10009798_29140 [Nocardioides panacihumi]|uniref:Uncharacterized protein n=1 Tax=Nocardioides panacihumi TaxID=400774 RepID=A0ABN2RCU6_9ACTN